eukprot:2051406-Amphidinium_carterae.1
MAESLKPAGSSPILGRLRKPPPPPHRARSSSSTMLSGEVIVPHSQASERGIHVTNNENGV